MSERIVKCVIWDLDETLWDGSLAENDEIVGRPHVIDMIRRLDEKGIVNSICSKNSYATAKQALQKLGIWDYFVFAVIDFVPKGQSVRNIIENLQLSPDSVLFVDDSISNRNEVAYYCNRIMAIDPNEEQFQPLMNQIIEHADGASRLDQYKILELKRNEKGQYAENAHFLAASNITMCVLRNPADMMFRERIFELANRSNQLNFTKSKFVVLEELDKYLTDGDSVYIHHGVVFVYDKYGDYGLVGFYAFDERPKSPTLKHFYFSCRVLNMGVEQALYSFLRKEFNVSRFSPMEARKDNDAKHIRIIREFDHRLRSYIENESSRPTCYRTSVSAGCTSGIIDHYLNDDMRPVRFELSVLTGSDVIPKTDRIIYTVYSDYINMQWSGNGGFSYERFQGNLAEFLRKHQDRKVYLLLASEKECVPPQRMRSVGIAARLKLRLKLLRSSVMNGESNARYRRCNRLVRETAKKYSNVTLVETGDFVCAKEEQHNATHFDRIVVKRICDHISGLECRSLVGVAGISGFDGNSTPITNQNII
jgi:FkbH-like protein